MLKYKTTTDETKQNDKFTLFITGFEMFIIIFVCTVSQTAHMTFAVCGQ